MTQIFVLLENCLVSVKSGSRYPRNIADFIPNYDLWFALKFFHPEEIIIIENQDLSKNPQSLWIDIKLDFLREYLKEFTKVSRVRTGYSYNGDWRFLFGYPEDKNILDFYQRSEFNKIFIDREDKENQDYIKERGDFNYITRDNFIREYNKTPRNTPLTT